MKNQVITTKNRKQCSGIPPTLKNEKPLRLPYDTFFFGRMINVRQGQCSNGETLSVTHFVKVKGQVNAIIFFIFSSPPIISLFSLCWLRNYVVVNIENVKIEEKTKSIFGRVMSPNNAKKRNEILVNQGPEHLFYLKKNLWKKNTPINQTN